MRNRGRNLWMPKLREAEQCASCPFREGNDKAFGGIVRALKKHAGMDEDEGNTVAEARAMAHMDVIGPDGRGDFVCHATAYGPEMRLRASSEHRQCPGATALYKSV